MKSSIKISAEYTLVLNDEEAEYIRSLMADTSKQYENTKDAKNRRVLENALTIEVKK